MPTASATSKIRQSRARLAPGARGLELGLEVRAPDGSSVLTAGGLWDRDELAYEPSATPHIITLVSSQVRAALQLAQWFLAYERDDPDRQALEVYVDNRRGGKTFFSVLAILLFAIRYPDCHLGKTICWLVVPTFPQQRELHEVIAKVLPAVWFRDRRIVYHKSEKYYTLANGAEIWIKSADRPQSLKAGGVAAVAVNEAQQVDSKGILNAMGANIDNGGVCWLAMNPPDSVKALWAENLHAAVNALDDDGAPLLPYARETKFPSDQNEIINQAAKTRFGKLAAILDPGQAKRDDLGVWTSIVDRAYPFYKREQHFRPEPVGWRDITADCNNFTGLGGRLAGNRHLGAGMDFQRRPYCAFIEAKAYVAPEGVAWVKAGVPVFVVRHEVCNDFVAGDWWTEELLCMKIAESAKKRGTKPTDYLLVADMTGHHQGAQAEQRGSESDPATYSWAIVENFGWDPHAPIEERRLTDNRKGPSSSKTFRANPPVAVRLNVVNELLRDNRVIISTNCKTTAEAFRTCGIHKESRKPKGDGSHLTDAVGYLLYAWETALREAGISKITGSTS